MSYPLIRDDGVYGEIVERIRSVSPDSERKWGVMDHSQLLVHMADGVRLCLRGPKAPASGPFRFGPLRYFALHVMKWPEAKIQAPPGAFERPSTTWEEDKATLLRLLDEYMATAAESLVTRHPAFGKMKPKDWDVLMYRHLDHHLRQFSA